MRWLCVLIAATVTGTSPWMGPGAAQAQSGNQDQIAIFPGTTPNIQFVQVGMTAIHPIVIQGAHADPIPEPSTAAALGLLGTAFLCRRRRPQIG